MHLKDANRQTHLSFIRIRILYFLHFIRIRIQKSNCNDKLTSIPPTPTRTAFGDTRKRYDFWWVYSVNNNKFKKCLHIFHRFVKHVESVICQDDKLSLHRNILYNHHCPIHQLPLNIYQLYK